MVAAMSINGVIGCERGIPWLIQSDFQSFLSKIKGSSIIVGRNTFVEESIHPIPRINTYVITSNPNLIPKKKAQSSSVQICSSLKDAIQSSKNISPKKDIWLIGGTEIYREGAHYAQELHLTLIYHFFNGQIKFPLETLLLFPKIISFSNLLSSDCFKLSSIILSKEEA